jgi:hypothetical protein
VRGHSLKSFAGTIPVSDVPTSYPVGRGQKPRVCGFVNADDDLDRLAPVPHHVALDDIQATATAADENARIRAADGRVVDDVVADDVIVRAGLDFDLVVAAVARAARVVAVVPLEQAVGRPACVVVAARVEALPSVGPTC